MEQLEWELQHVVDGAAGRDYFEEGGQADLVVLDLNMPGWSGLELLSWLRDRPQTRTLPVVLHSWSDEAKAINEAYRLGAWGFLVKPKGIPDLRRLVRSLCTIWLEFNLPPTIGD